MGNRSLVALDTNHIKQYVFATDKLKEIRGASSLLDKLNRKAMEGVAQNFNAQKVFAHGGSGLFLIDGDETVAENFGRQVQQRYEKETIGGASIAFAIQEVPESIQNIENNRALHPYMRLLYYRLFQAKDCPHHDFEVLPSHPFIRLCDACGVRYAEAKYEGKSPDSDDQERRYCKVCLKKRSEDHRVKEGIEDIVVERAYKGRGIQRDENPFVWESIISNLPTKYKIPIGTDRPSDFNKLQGLSGGKDYLGLIYADANNMGAVMDELETIEKRKAVANLVDASLYKALSVAIAEHLPVVEGDIETPPMFPFDILMIGGDDVIVVTPANVALDVALTLAKTFHEETKEKDIRPKKEGYTLSVGVILAPIKYPFGLLQGLAETTLKAAKKKSERRQNTTAYGYTSINFMVVAGSTSHDFDKVYKKMSNKDVQVSGYAQKVNFYATLRPYSVEELEILLKTIRDGKKKSLGRTKLHQVREAVLKMNLTTSVGESLAVLRNWKQSQREFVYNHVYGLGGRYQERHQEIEKPGTLFPRVTFPWFADGDNVFRTSLLDFVELYDFVASEGDSGTEDR